MKERIYKLVEKGAHGKKVNILFDYFIMGLILLNVIAMILESIPEINGEYHEILTAFEVVSVIIFSIEYLMRIYVAGLTHHGKSTFHSRVRFMTSAYGIIDLLAILPFFLPFLIKVDLRFLRMLRLTRFLRILKIDRYTKSLKTISNIVNEKKSELLVTVFLASIVLLIASFLMFEIESKVQPEAFPNVLASMWWALATLTTIGYGDVYPVTALGKLLSGVIAVVGIGLIALPGGIIASGFIEKIQKKKVEVCPHCGKAIH